jgi:hypothetical protein
MKFLNLRIKEAEEKIPVEVLEEFDELYPEQLFLGGHQFECEKCELVILINFASGDIFFVLLKKADLNTSYVKVQL